MSTSTAVQAQPGVAPAAQGAKITRAGGLKIRIKLPPKHPGFPANSPAADGSQQPSTSGRSSLMHSSPSGAVAPAAAGFGVDNAAMGPAWDLNSAVAQMRSHGIRGLGATLLSPWHHMHLEPRQQEHKRAWDVVSAPAPVPAAKRPRLEGKGAAYALAAMEAAAAAEDAAAASKAAPATAGPSAAAKPGSAGSRQQRALLTEEDFAKPASSLHSGSPVHSQSPLHKQQRRSQGNRTRRRTAMQLDEDEDETPHAQAQQKAGASPTQQPQQKQHQARTAAQASPQWQQQQQEQPGFEEQQQQEQQEPQPPATAGRPKLAGGSPAPHTAAEPAAAIGRKREAPAPAGNNNDAAVVGVALPPAKRPRSAPAATAAPVLPAAAPAAAAATASQVAITEQHEPAPSAAVDSQPKVIAAPPPQQQQQGQQAQQAPQPAQAPSPVPDSPAPTPVAPAPTAPAPATPQQLYDFGPLPLSGAAAALASVSLQPPKLERKSIANVTSVGEALIFLDALHDGARKLKKSGDRGFHTNRYWDVRSLAYYTLSGVTFIEYAGYHAALQAQLRASGALVDVEGRPGMLPNMSPLLLQQTADMLNVAVTASSTAQGSDLAKQGIRVLIERLMAICHMRHLQQHQQHLRNHVQRVKQGVRAAQAGSGAVIPAVASSSAAAAATLAHQRQQQHQQQQQRQVAAAAAHTKGAAPVPQGSGKRRSPDDSLQSTQERLPDHQPTSSHQQSAASRGAPHTQQPGGAALTVPLSPMVLASQGHLVSAVQQALRMTDLMHQTVMRLQQFLERPEVQACAEAKQAAVHISAVGLDAGMYSIDHVAAHARAAVRCLLNVDAAARRAV